MTALSDVQLVDDQTFSAHLAAQGGPKKNFADWKMSRVKVIATERLIPERYRTDSILGRHICPITHSPIAYPVRMRDGRIFEKAALLDYLTSVPSGGSKDLFRHQSVTLSDVIVDDLLAQDIRRRLEKLAAFEALLALPLEDAITASGLDISFSSSEETSPEVAHLRSFPNVDEQFRAAVLLWWDTAKTRPIPPIALLDTIFQKFSVYVNEVPEPSLHTLFDLSRTFAGLFREAYPNRFDQLVEQRLAKDLVAAVMRKLIEQEGAEGTAITNRYTICYLTDLYQAVNGIYPQECDPITEAMRHESQVIREQSMLIINAPCTIASLVTLLTYVTQIQATLEAKLGEHLQVVDFNPIKHDLQQAIIAKKDQFPTPCLLNEVYVLSGLLQLSADDQQALMTLQEMRNFNALQSCDFLIIHNHFISFVVGLRKITDIASSTFHDDLIAQMKHVVNIYDRMQVDHNGVHVNLNEASNRLFLSRVTELISCLASVLQMDPIDIKVDKPTEGDEEMARHLQAHFDMMDG